MNRLAILMIAVLMLFGGYSRGQNTAGQITWDCVLKRKSPEEGEISMKAKIPQGWHLYALGNNPKSPIQMNFKFAPDKSYELIGDVSQPQPLRKFEKQLGIPVTYFENEVEFGQKIKIKSKNGTIKGTIQFMQCSDEVCVPPQDFGFALKIRP
ncbi:protein-disulfide reductase DsbD N-terminal domain-containing protein [Sphingobacterium sp. InxBP1]|uniref:protein-disulfide reductase DsbD domain-containing protein n=1 Tax=Sphingobacterium sp. InxBP1 TaxID=2870328 RepID=UPI002243E38D|nr:protein-disulfide reductase DsbD domain-containing protein [Sphingobacterium sp. InxBP1]MCW8311180.1 protein-disulfide reductase DsbD N-terminal domain-containing protein [Sphingobacterium sp. InxBP1]